MLVLTSFVLVLVATGLLVVGLLDEGGLTLIYTSIACSVAAGVVLAVAVKVASPNTGSAADRAPLDGDAPAASPGPGAGAPAPVGAQPDPPDMVEDAVAPRTSSPTPAGPMAAGTAPAKHEATRRP